VIRSFNETQYEISPKLMWSVDWQTAWLMAKCLTWQ
jgi:hypothetical protein